MQHIFMDESGCLAFGPGATQYFVLAMIAPKSGTELSKTIKNINAHLIRNDWNQQVEIKASNVWNAGRNSLIPNTYKYKQNPTEPMEFILNAIAGLDCCIDYTVIKLDTVKPHLRTVPNTILYNYFAWQLLNTPLCHFPAIELFVDRRNREYHHQLKFDGYIEGKLGIQRAERGKQPAILTIRHYHADSASEHRAEERGRVLFGVRGLEAADFVCWAIKSAFEDSNDRWISLIKKRLKLRQHLYFKLAETPVNSGKIGIASNATEL